LILIFMKPFHTKIALTMKAARSSKYYNRDI